MFLIILTSICVSVGSYLIRKGNLVSFFLNIFQKSNNFSNQGFLLTLFGIILNIIAIFLWQISSKLNMQYQLVWSTYLSLSLVFGSVVAYIFERNKLELNFYIGTALIISGIIVLARK